MIICSHIGICVMWSFLPSYGMCIPHMVSVSVHLRARLSKHQVKVVAQQSDWDPNAFLGKVFASLEMSFASEHDVLGIQTASEGIGEDLYMVVEEPEAWGRQVAPANVRHGDMMRQRERRWQSSVGTTNRQTLWSKCQHPCEMEPCIASQIVSWWAEVIPKYFCVTDWGLSGVWN